MNASELNDRLGLAFNRMDCLYRDLALEAGLPQSVFWILYMLWCSPVALTSAQLVQYGGLPKQTVSSALSHIRQKGYISQKSPRSPVSLSETGCQFCNRLLTGVREMEFAALETMGEDKAVRLVALLEDYVRIFGNLETARQKPACERRNVHE